MADTFTTNLKVRLPETGQYFNSWGTTLNSDAIELLDHAIAGNQPINLGVNTTYSLAAMANGAASESRQFSLTFTGTPGGAVTVTVPASVTKKLYLIRNDCGQTITVKYSASTGVTVADGTKQFVWCDGTEVYRPSADAVNALTLGGIAAANYARLENPQTFTKAQRYAFVELLDAPSITIACADGNNFELTLGDNRTLANPSGPADGQTIQILVKQDGSGNRALAYGSAFVWPDGVAPTLTTTPGRADLIIATYNETYNKWISSIILNFPV